MDLARPRPVSGSRFHPRVIAQMSTFAQKLRKVAPTALGRGIRIAVENHCDSFSEEILWLLDQVDHPSVGACIDTVNALHVTEDPMVAIRNLVPRAFTNHFRDNRIEFQRWGFKLVGVALGEGDIDMKTAYELIRDQSSMERINIETEMETPLDDMEKALAMEVDAVRRSVTYCREVLGIRPEIIEQLGEENQGSPVLVLPDDSVSFDGIKKSMTTGKLFIDDALSICNYLAQTYSGILPHPQD